MTRFLSDEAGVACVPPYMGTLALASPSGDAIVGALFGFVKNQGDGWTYTLDALARYFDRVLEARQDFTEAAATEHIGAVYRERARQLGQRTAEMHRALASGEDRPEFAPESFSTLYQRSLYQAMRGASGRVLRLLRRQLPHLPEEARTEGTTLLASHAPLLKVFAGLLDHRIDVSRIRIHGDFHLGQVLNTGKGIVTIIDFEGESRLPLSERRLKRVAPCDDAAGMLRSFQYPPMTAAPCAMSGRTTFNASRPGPRHWIDRHLRSLSHRLSGSRRRRFLPACFRRRYATAAGSFPARQSTLTKSPTTSVTGPHGSSPRSAR